ncbi:MAG: molybdate transport system substrate-binding protein [Alphaproteobacteria bacterium]|jgi:molybdate transport system substrate-binding protein|nr:molybdate transport system substrate-binding protein [Alphaproteobacteria bacterium]
MRAIVTIAALVLATATANAAEIKALITTAMHAAIVELVPPFERATGHKATVSYDPSGGLARRLRNGEPADMILIASIELDKLIGERKVKDRTDVSRTGIGLAVRKGSPHPDVSTPDALKRTLLAAKSIAQSSIESGGITALHVQRVLSMLGIREQVSPRLKFAKGGPNGRVSVLVSSGEAEIGLQQVSELMSNPDVEVIGLLPDKLQQITINAAGITANAKEPDAARALIKHLTTPEALTIYKAKGLGL